MTASKNTTITAARATAIVAIIATSTLLAACGAKEDKAAKDVAAIRAMMEKKEADAKSDHEKDQANMAAMRAADRAARQK